MPPEITLASTVYLEVLRNVVVGTAIVIVDRKRSAVVAYKKVSGNVVVGGVQIRLRCLLAHVSQKRLTVLLKAQVYLV